MRSCDSLIRISAGPSDASRSGTVSSLTRMPSRRRRPPPARSSRRPPRPRRDPGCPAPGPPAYSSRQHSMSSFSMNGSPTWTLGRLAPSPPHPPAPERRAGQHRRPADAVRAGLRAEQDDLVARARGRGQLEVVVPQYADAQGVDQRVARVAGVERRARRRCWAGRGSCRRTRCRRPRPAAPGGCPARPAGPNRSASITATGRAPMARMSRTMPPTPVAAPWNGST